MLPITHYVCFLWLATSGATALVLGARIICAGIFLLGEKTTFQKFMVQNHEHGQKMSSFR
jgi:hypothetical protein